MSEEIENYNNSEMDLQWQLDIWDEDTFQDEDLADFG